MNKPESETAAMTDDRLAEIKSQAATLTYRPTKRAADELIAEIERLRAENADLIEGQRILDQAIAHNAAMDREEIAYWKDRSNDH